MKSPVRTVLTIVLAVLPSTVLALPKNTSSHSRWTAAQSNRSKSQIHKSTSHNKNQSSSPYSASAANRSPSNYATGSRTGHVYFPSSTRRATPNEIARRAAAKHEFMKRSGFPSGRPGYVVAHVLPLQHGGFDSPRNMQWVKRSELNSSVGFKPFAPKKLFGE